MIKKSLLTLLILFFFAACDVCPAFSYLEKHINKRDNIFDLINDETLITTSENPGDSPVLFSDDNTQKNQINYDFDEKKLGNINLERYNYRTSLSVRDYDNKDSITADNPRKVPDTGKKEDPNTVDKVPDTGKKEDPDTGDKVPDTGEKTPDNEEAQKEEPNTGENPAKPKTRFEFRFKYQNLSNDRDVIALTLRGDKVIDLDNHWALALRADFPLLYNDISPVSAGPAENYKFGSSDLVTQILFIPPRDRTFDIFFGVQHILPLGSDDQFGRGKYIIAPVFGLVDVPSSLPGGSFYGFLLRNEMSYAGNENRRDVNELVVQPFFNLMLPDRWFICTAPDMRINWEQNNSFFLPVDLIVGKVVGNGKSLSLKTSVGVIKDYNFYDYQLEFTTAIYF
ncbi:MAG: hypothetical protein ABRQ37_12020 [Candidatus Eremiobacterota bacterium]